MNRLLKRVYLLLDFFVEKPWRGLVLLMGLQVLAFGVMGIFYNAIPHGDMIQFPYFVRNGDVWLNLERHPPLVNIIVHILGVSEKTSFLAHYIVAQFFVIATYGTVYLVGVALFKNKAQALAATLLLVGLDVYQSGSWVGINHNVVQYPLWALIPLLTFYATRPLTQKAHQHLWWLLLGFVMGFALWTKYSIVLLLATVGLWIIIDKEARDHLFTPYPYWALLICLCLAAIPLEQAWQYSDAIQRHAQRENTENNLWLRVLLTLELMLIAALLAGLLSKRTRFTYPFHNMTKRETNFLCMFALMPFVILFLIAIIIPIELRHHWTFSMYPLWGILLVAVTRSSWWRYSAHIILILAVGVLLKPFYQYPFKREFYPRLNNPQVVAEKIIERVKQETNYESIAHIYGDHGQLAGLVALFASHDMEVTHPFWDDDALFQKEKGVLLIFNEHAASKERVRQKMKTFNLKEQSMKIDEYPHVIYYAILPPAEQ